MLFFVRQFGYGYLEFPGWTDQTSVQSFIERVKNHLLDEESIKAVDALLTSPAVNMLYKRLRGRFRPIVTAIEGIISSGDPNKCEEIIDNTEAMLISWKDRERRGNLLSELDRVENKIAKYPNQFVSASSIKETLGLFLYRWYILGETAIVLEDDAQLVEAAFGRIKMLGGDARVVLDEPMCLKATQNYFKQKDPLFIAAAERAMLTSTNPSVNGTMWESLMSAVFVQTFKSKPLHQWPLLPNSNIPDKLTGDVTIVGYDEHEPQLAITHKDITTQAFMEAHAKDGSMQGEKTIPPFYFPAPHESGKAADEALATTSGGTVQAKMDKEHEKITERQPPPPPPQLEDYCPSEMYVSMVITYPAEVIRFQVKRPDPTPEIPGSLRHVIINIDDNNFAKIFPERHVKFLDKLKRFKRRAEDDIQEEKITLEAQWLV
ncbi:hypothetical protein BGX26_003216 [Mortierella sp. AD094]|nr:hypothetical protein BGX26_003216 [Mortierella sp. AD094]